MVKKTYQVTLSSESVSEIQKIQEALKEIQFESGFEEAVRLIAVYVVSPETLAGKLKEIFDRYFSDKKEKLEQIFRQILETSCELDSLK